MNNQLFSDTEYQELLLLACGDNGASDKQMLWFVKQCELLKIHALMLKVIQSGEVVISNITEHDFTVSRKSQPV